MPHHDRGAPLRNCGTALVHKIGIKAEGCFMHRIAVAVFALAAVVSYSAHAEVLIGVSAAMTGRLAWIGEQGQRGAEMAVADINAAGGVLGQRVRLIAVDDFCDPEQAVAVAKKLVADGVVLVVGHYCSGASIPASKVYEAAGVLQISPGSTNPLLTEQGRANVFASLVATMRKASSPATIWPIIGATRKLRSFMMAPPMAGALPMRQKSS